MNTDFKSACPVIYVHVPKSAGEYINHQFFSAYGSDKCVKHFEDKKFSSFGSAIQGGIRFISGHISYPDAKQRADEESISALYMISLRNPVSQLASHLQWVDFFGEPGNTANLKYFSPELREEIVRIRSVDFCDARSLDNYLQNLSEIGIKLFDNVQCRYLCRKHENFAEAVVAEDAIANLRKFDYLVRYDTLDDDLMEIAEDLGLRLQLTGRLNSSPSQRKIDLKNSAIFEALRQRVVFDEILYKSSLEFAAVSSRGLGLRRRTR